ncbi:MAG: AAA family ATPase [Ruminococcaceae bacterium]|nr:AAA family ATPase [Oscillospiraceae bacterium]
MKGIDFNAYGLRPSGSYLSDFYSSLEQAEKAADELMKETAKHTNNVEENKAADNDAPEKLDLDELLGELDSLIGLEKVKENVRSLINLVKVRKLRAERDLPTPAMSLHLVFMGNPGTGKTTVARLVAKLYHSIGVLSKGQLVEVDRSGLVAGYVGQTAIKTKEAVDKALGGVLFIDEAYALTSSTGQNDFGREAVDTLLKAMEDHRDDFVVIVAGYDDLMEDFISSNPGLESRFNRYLVFDDYSGQQLTEIFLSMCAKNKYTLEADAEKYAAEIFTRLYEERDDNFGNARDVRNFFENVITVHSDRIAPLDSPSDEDLVTVKLCDLKNAEKM